MLGLNSTEGKCLDEILAGRVGCQLGCSCRILGVPGRLCQCGWSLCGQLNRGLIVKVDILYETLGVVSGFC